MYPSLSSFTPCNLDTLLQSLQPLAPLLDTLTDRLFCRSHALRGNASCDALRHALGTQSVPGCIPTQSVGMIGRIVVLYMTETHASITLRNGKIAEIAEKIVENW